MGVVHKEVIVKHVGTRRAGGAGTTGIPRGRRDPEPVDGRGGAKGRSTSPILRMILIALAAALVAAACVCTANIMAISTYNQATSQLNIGIHKANQPNPDLNALQVLQSQTDAQFSQAGSLGFLLLPKVKQAISTNQRISRTLTRHTHQEIITEQKKAASHTSSGNPSSASSGSTGGLTESQRKQVEDMLKANQQSSDSPSSSSSSSPSSSSSHNTTSDGSAKPW
jgi:hypothetical protein